MNVTSRQTNLDDSAAQLYNKYSVSALTSGKCGAKPEPSHSEVEGRSCNKLMKEPLFLQTRVSSVRATKQ